jgi:arginine/ornithine N-succinyltransferase beta subunit
VLEADLDTLPAVTQARVWSAASGSDEVSGTPYLVMTEGLRAVRCLARALGAELLMPAAALQALALAPGQPVWARPL